jgi:competence protein ComEA
MKRKYLILAAACSFLLIAGICYSCMLKKDAAGNTVWNLTQQQDISDEVPSEQEHAGVSEEEALDQANAEKGRTEITGLKNSELRESGNSLPKNTYAHICGAVINPGVYPITEDYRVVDLVELAGGFTEEAAEDYINQAVKVQDGQRVYIPTQEEVKVLSVGEYMAGDGAFGTAEQEASETSGEKLININTATAEELMKLPGVGEAKAASIIEYRNTKGKFKTIQDLMKISGIKEGLFNKVSSYITVK